MVAAFGYMGWGWAAVFSNPQGFVPGMLPDAPWGPAEYAAAREKAARYASWARACRGAGFVFAGVALGCAATLGWRARRDWRKWPWPSLACFVPALFALAIALMGEVGHALQKMAFAFQIVSLIAALIDLFRTKAGSASRPLAWTVLVVSLLAIVIRPLLWR